MRCFRRLFRRPNHVKYVVCLADPSYIACSHYGVVVLNDSDLSQICDAVYPRWIKKYCEDTQDLNISKWSF